MTISIGQRLGSYEITALVGEGGRGTVYRATDTRLNRAVAIKVCSSQFSERFAQEASVIASLNHPHICHLYDVGPNYLVMEFVDGTPLRGPLPLKQAVEYAGQMLDALAPRTGKASRIVTSNRQMSWLRSKALSYSISAWPRGGGRLRKATPR